MAPEELPATDQGWINDIARAFAAELTEPENLERYGKLAENVAIYILKFLTYFALRVATPVAVATMESLSEVTEATKPQRARLLSSTIKTVFDVDVSEADITDLYEHGKSAAAAGRLSESMISALTGGSTSVQPSKEPADRYLRVIIQQAFEGWMLGTTTELISALVPGVEQIQTMGEIGNRIVAALGITDSSSRVLRPYIDNLVVEPLRRYIAQTYTPNLLSESQVIQANLRGAIDEKSMSEELAQLGWSPKRIALLKEQYAKYLSFEDALVLERDDPSFAGKALEALLNQGFQPGTAEFVIRAAKARRQFGIIDNAMPSLVRAFITGEIPQSRFQALLQQVIPDPDERVFYELAATMQRDLTVTHMSQAEVIDCVQLGILPTSFYRAWLTREGYPPEEALALELRLRARIDQQRTVEQHRRELEAERAREKAERDREKADRLEKAEAERALARRGALSDLRRAAARGLIPLTRVAEVLNAQYDADFVQTVLDLVEADRVEYLRQQQAREDAEKRAMQRRIDIGALEQAVLTNVLDIDRFRQAIRDRGIVDEDADILTATLRQRKADLDDAKAKRAAAEQAAKIRRVDVGRFELLVRRGHRSIGDYAALLASLGFDDASQAAMVDLLQIQIADDTAARQAREDAARKLRAKGVSLETMRRAVILELATLDQYAQFLMAQGFTADAAALMVKEVEIAAAEAKAARDRRPPPEPPTPSRPIPLGDVRRAARLNIIDLDTYRRRLVDAGYDSDDVELEISLLLYELAQIQEARTKQDAVDRPDRTGLTLAQLAAAVRAGVKHLEDYRAAAASNPDLSRDDVDTLVRVLADELAATDVARARRAAIGSTVQPGDVALSELEERVRAGTLSVEDYVGMLEGAGLDIVDIDLLTTLLVDELAASTVV